MKNSIEAKISNKKTMRVILFTALLIMLGLMTRVGYIQIIKGSELSSKAYEQQTLNRKISPKRGTIYDATGEHILAVSSTVETVSVNPVNIKKEDTEKVA